MRRGPDQTDGGETSGCVCSRSGSSLQPVRHCLHTYLDPSTAVRLLQTSHAVTALLADYALVGLVLSCKNFPVAAVRRFIAFYARYRMRIVSMCLPGEWDRPLVKCTSRLSLLPPSLIALALGDGDYRSVVYAFHAYEEDDEAKEEAHSVDDMDDYICSIRDETAASEVELVRWIVPDFGNCDGDFNQPISPGALPSGLRLLQFNERYNQPLQPGSIPDSVEVLQMSRYFTQPLKKGHLPASLTHLVLGHGYDHPLLRGVLPAGLLRLSFGFDYNQPLLPGSLPPQLQQLSLGLCFNQPIPPGVIPSSVTRIRLSDYFDQPLQPGSIPHGVAHLYLGNYFNQPLLPGVLPASLRRLELSDCFDQPLQPGSLPDGLEVLDFSTASFDERLQPGVIPASVVAVTMPEFYTRKLVAGGIPATVRWLKLPHSYRKKDLTAVLSPSTRVVWWPRRIATKGCRLRAPPDYRRR